MKIRTATANLLWRLKNGKPHQEYDEYLRLQEMHVTESGLNATLQGSAIPALIESFGDVLASVPAAKNHLSVDCFHPKYGRLEVLIQKANGKTPAQINGELKAENERLRRELAVRERALFDACLRISALQYKINRKKSCPAEVLGKCQESEMRPNCSPTECWQAMFICAGKKVVDEMDREEAAELEKEAENGKD